MIYSELEYVRYYYYHNYNCKLSRLEDWRRGVDHCCKLFTDSRITPYPYIIIVCNSSDYMIIVFWRCLRDLEAQMH